MPVSAVWSATVALKLGAPTAFGIACTPILTHALAEAPCSSVAVRSTRTFVFDPMATAVATSWCRSSAFDKEKSALPPNPRTLSAVYRIVKYRSPAPSRSSKTGAERAPDLVQVVGQSVVSVPRVVRSSGTRDPAPMFVNVPAGWLVSVHSLQVFAVPCPNAFFVITFSGVPVVEYRDNCVA